MQLLKLRNQRQQLFLVRDEVDLVKQQKDRRACFLGQVKHKVVGGFPFPPCVDNQQDQIASFHGLSDLLHHLAAKGTVGTVHTRCVDQNNLPGVAILNFRNIDDAENAVAG